MTRIKKNIIWGTLILTLFISLSFKSKFFEVAKQLEIYTTLFKELNMYYVDEINPAEFTTKAIKNTLKDLDPYTNYYTEQDVEDAKIRREGEYGGIGVSVFYTKKGIKISEVYKDFPADKAAIKTGDVIVKLNDQSLENMDKEQISMLLKGVPNSSISVEVLRQGKIIPKKLTREKVVINPVPFYKMVNNDIGYIALTRFNAKASSEVKKAFKELKSKGMTKLIFDLRYNPGGSLLEAINISNFFLPKDKIIVSTKAKIKKWSNIYKSTKDPLDLEIPISVLINNRSASASEIVSGSLQDYDRAVILGERSFGKGLVQRYRKLTYGTQLKVTISKYYTPSGRCIQELDYANRKKDGTVPKFSEKGVQKFTTQNGRTVFDGGGVFPDIEITSKEKTTTTKELLKSHSIFDYATTFAHKHKTIGNVEDYSFSDSDFKQFQDFIKKDTSFTTTTEIKFKEAFKTVDSNLISKEHQLIKEKLTKNKVSEITENKELIKELIKKEILKRYYYKEGVYLNSLKNDKTILEAIKVLENTKQYKDILKNK